MTDLIPIVVWNDVDKGMVIAWPDEFVVFDRSHAQTGPIRTNAGGDNDVVVEGLGLHCTEHYVLLQDLVVGEGAVSRIEDVDSAKAHLSEKETTERFKIGTVTEAPRRDGDYFAARSKEPCRYREEARVQIGCLKSDGAEQPSLARVCPDLPVRRVEDGTVQSFPFSWCKEIAGKGIRARLQEVVLNNAPLKSNPNVFAHCPA